MSNLLKDPLFFKEKVYQKESVQKDLLAQTGLLQLKLSDSWGSGKG